MSNNNKNLILYRRFRIKSGKKEEFKELLSANMRAMEHKIAFVSAVFSDDIDNPNEVTLFEIWKGTKESWLAELPKPYRNTYENKLVDLIDERIISYLIPMNEWRTNLSNKKVN
ncbi:antibiotic biosynthesis monooxygenase [Bacillus albus]|nr:MULTISPECIES: antibiotic biosynthesis monooxygenase family protein [unclassified Bacillus cereus group]MBU5218425.1 antibiotic biosynthesis monooxygenase [Bacillus albus]MDA2226023.1 antibiotic biosynthesis monooxygenase [Bacillus cereus group sp. Bc227]MDA2259929.1 antibiotic biosynthesis monooxygenase [Bacillus cereus group sp. Bc200]HDR7719424.1 antibiotic biosynthesis monooxygenase [Bacillus albus]